MNFLLNYIDEKWKNNLSNNNNQGMVRKVRSDTGLYGEMRISAGEPQNINATKRAK